MVRRTSGQVRRAPQDRACATPKYLVLIYGDEQKWAEAAPEWHEENAERHRAFIAAAGRVVLGANELEPTTNAVTLRSTSGGRPHPSDGPFLETKEAVGGDRRVRAG
jgi:hypothetical protein